MMFQRKKHAEARRVLVAELNELINELETIRSFPWSRNRVQYIWSLDTSMDDLAAERDALVETLTTERLAQNDKVDAKSQAQMDLRTKFESLLVELRSGVAGERAYLLLEEVAALHYRHIDDELKLASPITPDELEWLTAFSYALSTDADARRSSQRRLLRGYLVRHPGSEVFELASAHLDHFLVPEVLVRCQHPAPPNFLNALLEVAPGLTREPLMVVSMRGDRHAADITGMSDAAVETLGVLLTCEPDTHFADAALAAAALEDA